MKKIFNIAVVCALIAGILCISSCGNVDEVEKGMVDSGTVSDTQEDIITNSQSEENSENSEDASETNKESESQTTADTVTNDGAGTDTGFGEIE